MLAAATSRFLVGQMGRAGSSRALHSSRAAWDNMPFKVNVKLVAQLRKELQVPMNKAREALTQCENDYTRAHAWLVKDAVTSGAASAAKLAERPADCGLVAAVALSDTDSEPGRVGTRGGLVELSCETDFVARNEIFRSLATRIAATAATLSTPAGTEALTEIAIDRLVELPLAGDGSESTSVREGIVEAIGKLKENIILRRALQTPESASPDAAWQPVVAAACHGGETPLTGKYGALLRMRFRAADPADVRPAFEALASRVARVVVGFGPRYLTAEQAARAQVTDDQAVLLNLPLLGQDVTVQAALDALAKEHNANVEVLGFERFAL
ncbi:Elongation factor Ts, mitochondrial [Tieghemiomyces parasiticus]|uniref:Elongation factor Ts, mitochondrial n=1 Tax=Tieghemiomyces parasiticus TaxID=78921 RepID=A0A9W8AFC5_9FUNG|nr:Elongation factor Ts, mitochondrial [Tieghemiomyces parasiticus]